MITINLSEIYLWLCKLSATVLLISVVTFGFLLIAVDVENDEDRLGWFAYIVAAAAGASGAMLIILLVVLIIYYIWKI